MLNLFNDVMVHCFPYNLVIFVYIFLMVEDVSSLQVNAKC